MEEDDELKLYAINSLANSDPERAAPLLKKIIDEPNHPKLKERALFVLAMTESPDALATVERLARGGGNPDVQLKAIQYVGLLKPANAESILAEVYPGAPMELKRTVLRAYTHMGNKEKLVEVAMRESDLEVAGEAIRGLGILRDTESLLAVYRQNNSQPVRLQVIRALAITGDPSGLIELAKNEADPELRLDAVRRLGMSREEEATKTLLELYANGNQELRREVLRALFIQQNAPAMVDLAREESDPDLKKFAVKHLAMMKAPEAQEFMLEVLAQ
jgi:HEAT repeat protein